MSFINSPKQFPAPVVGEGIELITSGSSSVADLMLLRKIPLEIEAVGESESLLNLGVTNGIKLAKTQGIGHASLYLGQDITDLEFITTGGSEISAFLRIDNEPNQFLENLISEGNSNVSLNLFKEGLTLFRVEGKSNAEWIEKLELVEPVPIIEVISSSDFKQTLKARLFINNVATVFRSARWAKPANGLGSLLNIVLADTKLSDLPIDATFKFEIHDGTDWITLLNNGKLDSRNITRTWGNRGTNDSLSFSTFSPIEDRFAIAPRKTTIYYDSSRTEIDVSDVPPIKVYGGSDITIETKPFNVLTLYRLLNIAFVEIAGFSEVETDIPNYPILRCTFDFRQSAKDSIAPFIGIFKPHFIPMPGNKLRILNGLKEIDTSILDEVEITERDAESLSLSSRGNIDSDGVTLQYQGSSLYGSITTDLVQKIDKIGNLGDPDYKEIHTNSYWREWKDDNGNLLDRKLLIEVKTTFKGAVTTEESTTEFSYDGEGREKRWRKIRNARLPLLPTGEYSLVNINETVKQNFYKTDPKNPSQIYLSSSVTNKSGLYTIDNDNPQLGQPVKRDYEYTSESKSLIEGMTTDLGKLETIVETFIPIGNGQVRCYISGTDDLNNEPIKPIDEIRAGDISLNGAASQPLEMVIWKSEINTTKGRPPQSFNIGEVPLKFGIPLVQYLLENPHQLSGSVPVLGFNKNLDRGQYFKLTSRGEEIGNFIIEGFEVVMENLGSRHKFTTNLEISEI